MSQPNLSLPQKPELVTLSPQEHMLHNAAQCRGQGEALEQVAIQLGQASAHYQSDDIKGALDQLAAQVSKHAAECKARQNVLLGQWIIARGASDEASEDLAPRRVGWAVRLWRATVARAWDWAFAK